MSDNFEKDDNTNKEKFYCVLAYVPLANFILFFAEIQRESAQLKRHKKQWVVLFWLYLITLFVLSLFSLWLLVNFVYLLTVVFFAHKAYAWEYIEIEFIEKIIKSYLK